jgi:hypothetical protein
MDDTLLQKQTEVLSQIADNMAKLTEKLDAKETSKETTEEETTKTPAGVHTAIRLHGSSGIFTGGLEREVITAHVRPYGLASQLLLSPKTRVSQASLVSPLRLGLNQLTPVMTRLTAS